MKKVILIKLVLNIVILTMIGQNEKDRKKVKHRLVYVQWTDGRKDIQNRYVSPREYKLAHYAGSLQKNGKRI